MKSQLIILLVSMHICSFAQNAPNPTNDNSWVELKNWVFTNMTMSQLLADWDTSPYLQQNTWAPSGNQTYGSSEPAFAFASNVELDPQKGLVLSIKKETNTSLANTYMQPDDIMPDGLPNLRTEDYTQASMRTHNPFKYGYIEGRIKCAYGYNFHSGFWSFVEHFGPVAPQNGVELDYFEMVPSNTIPGYPNNQNIMKTNYHMKDGSSLNEDRMIGNYTVFRNYSVHWTPNKIVWYVDGVLEREIVNPGLVDPFLVFLNFSLNPIQPNASVNESLTPIPSEMLVEYIRIHQLSMDCSTEINDCLFSFAGYDHAVKKSITIGQGGCSNYQPYGTELFLKANDFIEINGEFTVPYGAELSAEIYDCY